MTMHMQVMFWLGIVVVCTPLALVATLGLASLLGRPFNERTISGLVMLSTVTGLLAAIGVLAIMLTSREYLVPIELGNWAHIESHDPEHSHFHFGIKFVFDRLSVPFVILSFLLCGTIGGFANRYMHREPGYNRFFFLYSVFLLGMVVTSLAGTIETLFAGWELVGVSSALLVAFFQERPAPVRNGLHVWSVYRISDAALLLAAVALHHLHGEGNFAALLGSNPWPDGVSSVPAREALIVGSLLLVAAAGKSALVPFSGWLPRAMEGPTPSSAVFYGALSVHLGAFLLLRISPLLNASLLLSAMVVVVGLATAVFAAMATRVQTDVKSSLAFASLTQVGIIVAEIGFRLEYLPLIHIIGHASLRTLQFLRASSILQDYRLLENAIGRQLPPTTDATHKLMAPTFRDWLYRFSLERGYFDAILTDYVARPVLGMFQLCDRLERRWTDFLSGGPSRESDTVGPTTSNLEDLG